MNLILDNGAEVITNTASHVLAKFNGEFVVWSWSYLSMEATKASCYWGHYFNRDFKAASEFYNNL